MLALLAARPWYRGFAVIKVAPLAPRVESNPMLSPRSASGSMDPTLDLRNAARVAVCTAIALFWASIAAGAQDREEEKWAHDGT